jgi:hypothetical protein
MAIVIEKRQLPLGGKLIRVQLPGARPGVCVKILEAEAIARGLIAPPKGEQESEKKREPVLNKKRQPAANK